MLAPLVMMFEVSGDPIRDHPEALPHPSRVPAMHGLRVLVVEDSYMSARAIARILEGIGATVVGPAPSVRAALQLIEKDGCDAAILDINLGNETVEPVAERLQRSGQPFIFVSGYGTHDFINSGLAGKRLLSKPVDESSLIESLQSALDQGN